MIQVTTNNQPSSLHFIIFIVMTLRKMAGMEAGVEDLQFEIKPRSTVFEDRPIPCFVLYLEKGMQVIGRYQSGTKHNTKDSLYRFKNPEIGAFRMRNLNHATYTWNIYQVDPNLGEEIFEEASNFDLKQTVELYEMELLQKQREIQTSYKEKNMARNTVLQLWSKTKKEMKNNKLVLKCIFQKLKIHLEFQVEIRNSLDLQIIEEEGKKHLLRRAKSQHSVLNYTNNLSPSEILSRPKVSQPLIIIDECVSPLLKAAKKQHEVQNHIENKSQHSILLKNNESEDGNMTVVKVINPTGKQLAENDYSRKSVKRSSSHSQDSRMLQQQPSKKFSMLSDIIEQSYEGSSNFGVDKITNGHNLNSQKYDEIQEFLFVKGQKKNIVNVDSSLNKFKTLPYDNFNSRKAKQLQHLKVDLRRAQTTAKDQMNSKENSEQNMGDEYQTNSQLKSSEGMQNSKETKGTSGDLNAKYIILVALLIILGIAGKELIFQCSGAKCKKIKTAKKIKN